MGISTNNKALAEVKEAEAHEYIDKISETVVPHTKGTTGGIQGVKDPYPEITYRKFQGESKVEEKQLTNIKNPEIEAETEAPPTIMPSLGADPLEDEALPEPPAKAQVVTDPKRTEAYKGGVDANVMMMQMMAEMLQLQKKGQEAPEAHQPEAPKAKVIQDKTSIKDVTAVTFQGAFGEVTAPFDKVVDGDFCVALIQNSNCAFNYTPPVDDNAEITIEWTQGNSTRTQTAINAGLAFKLSNNEKVLVLLKGGS